MNLKQHAFVNEYLYWNDATVAYKNAYNSKSSNKTIESAGNRLLKNPEVAAAIERSLSAVRSRVENEVAQRLKVELLTIQEKRTILAQIARGDIYIEHHYKGKNCTQCTQYIKPSYSLILRALQEDSRLAGHYPDQRIHKHNKSQHWTLATQNNTSPLQGDRGTTHTEHSHNSPTTQNHNKSKQPNEVNATTQLKMEQVKTQQITTTEQKPLRQSNTAVKHKPLNTVTHAGLRKLFAKTRKQTQPHL